MEIYKIIKNQRKTMVTPVDQIGCAYAGKNYTGDTRRFYILVSLLLSSSTRDEITNRAVLNLEKKFGILSPETFTQNKEEEIHECIEKVGYHRKKTQTLIKIGELLTGKEMPDTLNDVIQLPGIGRKMGNLYLEHGCGKTVGIGVDSHVHKITNRIGLVKTKNPEETRKRLEEIFDIEEWPSINEVLVGFGQTICKTRSPKCEKCMACNLCPYKKRAIDSYKHKSKDE